MITMIIASIQNLINNDDDTDNRNFMFADRKMIIMRYQWITILTKISLCDM